MGVQVHVSYPTRPSAWARWIARLLWSALWFWMGFRLAIPLFLRDNLFLASAVNVIIALVFGLVFGLIGLSKPSLLRSRVGFWAFGYWFVTVASSLVSPFVTQENIFRVFGLLAVSGAIILTLVVFFNIFAPDRALAWAAQAYVPGVLLATANLVLMNPYVLTLQEAGVRFGDPELLHPNSLGIAYGIGVLYLLFLRLYRTIFWQSSLAFLMMISLFATLSKTAILGTLVAIALAFWLLRGVQKLRLVSLLFFGGLAICLFGGNYVIDRIQVYFSSEQAETLSGRKILWDWVIYMVAERPFWGYGYQVMKDLTALDPRLVSTWSVSIVHAHNAYLDIMFSSGYLGLSVFAVFWLYSLRLLWLGSVRLGGSSLRSFLVAMLFLLVSRSFTEGALNLGFDFWMAMTAALAIEKSLRMSGKVLV